MIFDAVVLAAVLISAVIAFLRGFIREFLTIVGVVGGFAAAYFGGPLLQPLMHNWLGVGPDPTKVKKLFDIVPMNIVADVCAYGLIFIVVVVILSVLSHFLSAGAKAAGLGPIDRTLGVFFGIARAALLLCLLYLPALLISDKDSRDDWVVLKDSRAQYYIEWGAQKIADRLPKGEEKDAGKMLDDSTKKANEKIDETRQRLDDMEIIKNAAQKAGDAIDKAQETLSDPNAADDAPGYQPEQRERLDQLIETNQ